MDHFLFLITGLIIGVICGMAITNINKNNTSNLDFEHSFVTLESIFEQYMDELNQKQKEIINQISKWEVKQKQAQAQPKERLTKLNTKSDLVMELLEKGHDQEQVAQKLGIGKGEVELISQLNNSKNTIDY